MPIKRLSTWLASRRDMNDATRRFRLMSTLCGDSAAFERLLFNYCFVARLACQSTIGLVWHITLGSSRKAQKVSALSFLMALRRRRCAQDTTIRRGNGQRPPTRPGETPAVVGRLGGWLLTVVSKIPLVTVEVLEPRIGCKP